MHAYEFKWGALKKVRFPEIFLKSYPVKMTSIINPENFEDARKRFAEDTDHFRLASLPGFPFAICRYLRKMEIYFEDLVLERENIDELHRRVTTLFCAPDTDQKVPRNKGNFPKTIKYDYL